MASMKSLVQPAGALLIALVFPACRPPAPPANDVAADRAAVDAALEEYRQAWLKGDTALAQRPHPRQTVACGAAVVVSLSVSLRGAAERRGAARRSAARRRAVGRDQRPAAR